MNDLPSRSQGVGSHQSVKVRLFPEPTPPSLDLYYKGDVIDSQGNIWERIGGSPEKIQELKEAMQSGFVISEGELPPGFREMDAQAQLELLAAEKADRALFFQSNSTTNIFNDNRTNQFFEVLNQTNSPSAVIIKKNNSQLITNNTAAPEEKTETAKQVATKIIINNNSEIGGGADDESDFYTSSVRPVVYRFMNAVGLSNETAPDLSGTPAQNAQQKLAPQPRRSLASAATVSLRNLQQVRSYFSFLYFLFGTASLMAVYYRKRFIPLMVKKPRRDESEPKPSEATFATSATRIKK